MLELISNIIVKGGAFAEDTSLPILCKRLNLLYGRNGSGKSTIAKCLKTLSQTASDCNYTASFPDDKNKELDSNVYVYDENFVSDNFKINQDGLTSIVMLGHQVGLDEKLNKLEKEQSVLLEAYNGFSESERQFDDSSNDKSPLWHFNVIKKKLSANGGWAERDRIIKDNSIKSAVTVDIFQELMELSKAHISYARLRREYDEKMEIFQKVKKGGIKIELLSNNVISNHIDQYKKLLELHLEEPHLSNRDKKIIDLVRSEHGNYLNQIHPVFDNQDMTVCPLCLRPMSVYDKKDLFLKIQQFFNKESEVYKQQLQAMIKSLSGWQPIQLSDLVKEIIGKDTTDMFINCGNELRQNYIKLCDVFTERLQNVYGMQPYFCWYEIKDEQDKYSLLLDKINSAILYYNKEIEQKSRLKRELIALNKQISSLQLVENFKLYSERLNEQRINSEKLNSSSSALLKVRYEISQVRSQKTQVSIALDFINDALSYIFFDKKRMVLVNSDGIYVLKVNGKDVKPKDVSTGERNAIALSYFFAKMFENHEKESRYSEEALVVLDDPITSFDKDNKVGIMSFLRWQINALYEGNPKTKVLIMSHELMTIFNLQKVYSDIDRNQFRVYELKDRHINDLNCFRNERNEYKKLMLDVFEVAYTATSNTLTAGNKMRRIEEAYSSFICNGKFETLLHDKEFLRNVPSSKKVFYQNFMSRLVLNTESHMEERVYELNDFSPMFDEDEIRKTAKYLLMLFYYVDGFHLKSYLGDKYSIVEQWIVNEDQA